MDAKIEQIPINIPMIFLYEVIFDNQAFWGFVCVFENKHLQIQLTPDVIIPYPAFLRS